MKRRTNGKGQNELVDSMIVVSLRKINDERKGKKVKARDCDLVARSFDGGTKS